MLGSTTAHSTLQLPESSLPSPLGPREPAHPGSPDAGRAAVRAAGHHPVHGLLDSGKLYCGRAEQHPLSVDSYVTCHAGTDSKGLLSLPDCLEIFLVLFFFLLLGLLSGPITCNYQTVRQVRAAEMWV